MPVISTLIPGESCPGKDRAPYNKIISAIFIESRFLPAFDRGVIQRGVEFILGNKLRDQCLIPCLRFRIVMSAQSLEA
jgi:hypothetical protein